MRIGRDELDTVKGLMDMSLRAVLADTLEVDIEAVTDQADLMRDLGMDEQTRPLLEAAIADTFDGVRIDLRARRNVAAVLDSVVQAEFRDLAA